MDQHKIAVESKNCTLLDNVISVFVRLLLLLACGVGGNGSGGGAAAFVATAAIQQ